MKLQRYNPCNNPRKYRAGCGPNAYKCNDGDYVLYSDSQARIEALEAENTALHAECDRLTAMLGPQKVLSAEEVAEPGFYWWKFADHRWVIVIARYDDSKIVIKTILGDEIFIGKFIGPIRLPEVSNA